MECYERCNWKIKNKIDKLPRKLTINKVNVHNKPEIADAFNHLFTNIRNWLFRYQDRLIQLKPISKSECQYISKNLSTNK